MALKCSVRLDLNLIFSLLELQPIGHGSVIEGPPADSPPTATASCPKLKFAAESNNSKAPLKPLFRDVQQVKK
jgi:hypothetical protein